MSKLKIHIENEKSAYLEIENSSNTFGVFSKSNSDFFIGFEDNPLFEIHHSLVNERWFFEVLSHGRRIPREDIIFDEPAGQWLRDSCCSFFSIFNYLPNGGYRLIKTRRKVRFMDKILYGNEWADSPENILTFDGIKEKDSMLIGNIDTLSRKQKKYYPLIIGNNADRAPIINQPLLCIILLDYGIVWEGATGFIFFSFGNDELVMQEEKKIILVMPYNDFFVIDCMNNSKQFDKRIIDDFIKII